MNADDDDLNRARNTKNEGILTEEARPVTVRRAPIFE